MPKLPLEGIRVLDITVVWAGPYCTSFLADLGAEVIRIESLNTFGPLARGSMAHPTEEDLKDMSPWAGAMPGRVPAARPWNRYPIFNAHARNKLGMTLDILRPGGMDIFKRLVKISDVFVENNPTSTMKKLGISYSLLQEQNPGIIMLRMPAYGNTGAYRNHRAYGLHIEGVIGHTLQRGYADMDPSANSTVLMSDAAGGTQGAFAVLAALHHRKRTGRGQLIELSQAENTLPYLGQSFMDFSMNGRNASTLGNHHTYAVQGCYPCKGVDRWVTITLFDDKDWVAFVQVLGNPDWCQEDRFADAISRYRHHDELDRNIAQWTEQLASNDVMRMLQSVGVAAGPVMDQRDAYEDPHLNEREVFEEVYQEDTGTHRYPGAPYKMSETPIKIRRGPLRLGEDNEYIYKTLLDCSDEEYAELEAQGHIGMDYPEDMP